MTQPTAQPTQPSDPRKVRVIVELIDHSTKIAAARDRGRPGGTAGGGQPTDQ